MAALIVVAHHFVQAFIPEVDGTIGAAPSPYALAGTPFYVLINGVGAVMVFFVLSGYVLSLKGLGPDATAAIAETALKRWFRLAPSVCLSVLLSYAIFTLGLQHYEDAAALNGSITLKSLFYGGLPQSYRPDIREALTQGLYRTFIYGDMSFNSALWTMRFEFLGSFFVFAVALFLRDRALYLLITFIPLYALLVRYDIFYIFLFPFFLGVAAAKMPLRGLKIGTAATLALLLPALYLCGYYIPEGSYAWLHAVGLAAPGYRLIILSLGAFLLLVLFTTDNIISRRFHGPASRMLGAISFPLYLIHVPVITSACAWAYIIAGGHVPGVTAAAIALIIMTAPLIWGMCRFEGWWLDVLHRWHPFNKREAALI